MVSWVKVNNAILKAALHRCKKVTLGIDATEIVAHKAQASGFTTKRKGFMPMVGHIAETVQIVDVDFRQGMYRQRKVIWRLSSNASSHYPKAVP